MTTESCYCHDNYRLSCVDYSMVMNDRNDLTSVALYTMLVSGASVVVCHSSGDEMRRERLY